MLRPRRRPPPRRDRPQGPGGKTEERVGGTVLDACLAAFRRLQSKDSLADLLKVARAKAENPRVRAWHLWALGSRADAADLAELLEDKQPLVQIAAADALADGAKDRKSVV